MKMLQPEHGYFNDDICDYLKADSILDKIIKVDREKSVIGFIGGSLVRIFLQQVKTEEKKVIMVSCRKLILI